MNCYLYVTLIQNETVQKTFRRRPLPCSEKEGSSPQKGLTRIQGFPVHTTRTLRKRITIQMVAKSQFYVSSKTETSTVTYAQFIV